MIPSKKIGYAASSRGAYCRLHHRGDGFSLIEVVIAVGIAAFALVTIMGLLPAGLSTFNKSINMSVGTQITQRVFSDMQASDFSTLQSTNRYFDEQGAELPAASNNAVNCIYWVRVDLATNPVTGYTSTNLLTVKIMVANNPAGRLPTNLLFSGTNPGTMVFSTLIGRNK